MSTGFCTGCGAPRATQAAFCGSCGAPTSAPATAPAPRPAARKRSRRLAWVAAGLVVALALIGGGVLAALKFAPAQTLPLLGAGRGQSTPQAAAETFVSAVASKDPLALLQTLEPELVTPLIDAYSTAQAKAAEVGTVGEGEELDAWNVELTDVTPTVTAINDYLARATFGTGQVRLTVNREQLSTALRDATAGFEPQTWDLGAGSDDLDITPSLVLTKNGDRWFVSPALTWCDIYYQLSHDDGSGEPVPLPANAFPVTPPAPTPSTDPRSAVDSFLQVLGEQGLDAAARYLTSSDQVVWWLAQILLDQSTAEDVADWQDGTAGRFAVAATVDSADVREIGDGQALVTVDQASGYFQDDYESIEYSLNGTCVRTTGVCERWGYFLNDSARVTLLTVEVDGGWVVSLQGSAAHTAQSALSHLDPMVLLIASDLAYLANPEAQLTEGKQTIRLDHQWRGADQPASFTLLSLTVPDGASDVVVDLPDSTSITLHGPDGSWWYTREFTDVPPGRYTVEIWDWEAQPEVQIEVSFA